MGGRYGDNLLHAAQVRRTVRRLKPRQKRWEGAWTDGHMSADFHIALTQLPGNDGNSLSTRRVLNPEEILREARTELTVHATDERDSRRRLSEARWLRRCRPIKYRLYLNMGSRFA